MMKYDLDETKIFLVCLGIGIFTAAIGVIYIYSEILFPAPKPSFISVFYTVITMFTLMIGLSFVIHGFHPILLVKSR